MPEVCLDALIKETFDDVHAELIKEYVSETSRAAYARNSCPDCGEQHLVVAFPKFQLQIRLTNGEAAQWDEALAAEGISLN